MSNDILTTPPLVKDRDGVLVLQRQGPFGYTDGEESERYLAEVFRQAADLSARSAELERHIKDWPSEYHLTSRRGQLLSGFRFDRSLRVLEVGCGCGAITRQLGETFDSVTSIEGSIGRARLARLRTRDLPGVTIVCAPFQEVRFREKFDLIFCIGVYEYSASFVPGPDPYEGALRYFRELLNPNGVLVLAIENQFGLKYFVSSREDHLGERFVGLEGYARVPGKVRTFGRRELERLLAGHFEAARFYYPYPDYKLPDCVLTEEFLAGEHAGELVSQQRSRDYAGESAPIMDEPLVTLELARNGMLPFFANSFLVIAGPREPRGISFPQVGVLYSPPSRGRFRTVTRLLRDPHGRLSVEKRPASGASSVEHGPLRLEETRSEWQAGCSLQTIVLRRAKEQGATLERIFEPCRAWLDHLRKASVQEGGRDFLDGRFLDCIWSNYYPGSRDEPFVDREWRWAERLPVNAVVARAIYQFLTRCEDDALAAVLRGSSGGRLIRDIAATLGATLGDVELQEFVRLEASFQSAAYGVDPAHHATSLAWWLRHRPSLRAARWWRGRLRRVGVALRARLRLRG